MKPNETKRFRKIISTERGVNPRRKRRIHNTKDYGTISTLDEIDTSGTQDFKE
jgi:hypothetical protein